MHIYIKICATIWEKKKREKTREITSETLNFPFINSVFSWETAPHLEEILRVFLQAWFNNQSTLTRSAAPVNRRRLIPNPSRVQKKIFFCFFLINSNHTKKIINTITIFLNSNKKNTAEASYLNNR